MVRTWPAGPAPGVLEVRVPGSSANLGPGFDSIGLALGIWDTYRVSLTGGPGLEIVLEGEGGRRRARATSGTWSTARCCAPGPPSASTRPEGIRLVCRNTVPQGRGLGSSAAAIVAGIVAAQGLHDAVRHGPAHDVAGFDRCFTNDLASAVEGHPDNASASVYGGMTVSWADDAVPGRVHSVQLDVHPDVVPVVLVPATTLPTVDGARGAPRAHPARPGRPELRPQRPAGGGRDPSPRPAAAGHPRVAAPGAAAGVLPGDHGPGRHAAGGAAMPPSSPAPVRACSCWPPRRRAGRCRTLVDQRVVARPRAGNALHRRERSACYIEEQPAETAEHRATSHRLH